MTEEDPRAPAHPMDPERLAALRAYSGQVPVGDWAQEPAPAEWIQDADNRDIIAELLAERDRLAAEVKRLSAIIGRGCEVCRETDGHGGAPSVPRVNDDDVHQ